MTAETIMLELNRVTYAWPGDAHARKLGPLSATIPKGQWVGLIGPNGAGKSTLLRLIAAYLKTTPTSIRVLAQDVSRLTAAQRARLLAFVPQTLDTSFDLTVREVVELGALNRLSWRERFGLHHGVSRDHMETVMRQTEILDLQPRPFTTLSGGEARRTLLASALMQEAPFLLLDEPTAHLDPGHAVKFLDLIRDMVDTRHLTVLMAYHDLATVGLYADVLWVMNEGQLVLSGTPDEVLSDSLIRRIYDTNLIGVSHPRTHRPILLFP